MQTHKGRYRSRNIVIAEQISKWWLAKLSEGAYDSGAHRSLLRNGADATVVTSGLFHDFIYRFSNAIEQEDTLTNMPLSFGEFEVLLPWMRALAQLRQDGESRIYLSRALAGIQKDYTSAKVQNLMGCETQEEFCAFFTRLLPMMKDGVSVQNATKVYLGWTQPQERQRLAYDVLMSSARAKQPLVKSAAARINDRVRILLFILPPKVIGRPGTAVGPAGLL